MKGGEELIPAYMIDLRLGVSLLAIESITAFLTKT